jgi:hypothetical protein
MSRQVKPRRRVHRCGARVLAGTSPRAVLVLVAVLAAVIWGASAPASASAGTSGSGRASGWATAGA